LESSELLELFSLELKMGGGIRALLSCAGVLLLLSAPAVERNPLLISLIVYVALALALAFLTSARWLIPLVGRTLTLVGMSVDLLFVTWLIYADSGVGSSLFLLYLLLILKSVLLYSFVPEAVPLTFLFAPLYVGVLFVSARSFYFLQTREFLTQYALLFALIILGIYTARRLASRQEQLHRLRDMMQSKGTDLERKTAALQSTASNLSARVLELRSIQEGFKAINSALALDDVLRLIVDNASRVLEDSPCYLALMESGGDRPTLATVALPGDTHLSPPAWRQLERIAAWIVSQSEPLSVVDLAGDDRFSTNEYPVSAALIGAPLFVDDKPVGALMATGTDDRAFESDQMGLLTAFADQAAVAVKNAWLYRDLAVEQRRSEEKSNELEAIVRGIGDGIIVTDPNLHLLLMNPRAARIFGLDRAPALHHPLSQLVGNPDLIELLEEVQEAPEQVAMREIVLPQIRDRQPIYQGLAASILNTDGKVSGIVAVLRDITGQKELERMKSNFLSVVSHELKTPLHSIKGFVDIILMGKTGEITDVQRDFLSTVKEQTTQLQRLISDLLEFSRLESGQIKLQPRELGPATLANEVIDKLTPLAAEGGVTLLSTLPGDFPSVQADPVRLEQVFSNLVDNAIKFTPAGGSITISGEDLGKHVRLQVTDTGVGIPEEERERVFDRFYQVESGSTRAYRGTGLGLTICKHIVGQHQGSIWVEGTEGEGATFVVELPKELSYEEDLSLDFSSLPARSTPLH